MPRFSAAAPPQALISFSDLAGTTLALPKATTNILCLQRISFRKPRRTKSIKKRIAFRPPNGTENNDNTRDQLARLDIKKFCYRKGS